MIGTMILPAWITNWQGGLDRMFDALGAFAFYWLLSGAPLLIVFVLAMTLKNKISTVVLLFSVIAYCVLYARVLHYALFSGEDFALLAILFIGIWSLPMMIPAWIIAYALDRRYAQTSATPSPPALLRDENTDSTD